MKNNEPKIVEKEKIVAEKLNGRFAMLGFVALVGACLLYTSPSPRDGLLSRMPSSA